MEIFADFDLTPCNTFAVASRARAFCTVREQADLLQALAYAVEQDLPLLVLGGGSNVLFIDDYPGLVVHMAMPGIERLEQDDNRVLLQVGAGENWHNLVMWCLRKGFYGIENLALIPGTVGAAPIQNIGAYGVELATVFACLTALEANSGEFWTFQRDDCQFGYRDSVFKHGRPGELIITTVTLQLSLAPVPVTDYRTLHEELERRHGDSVPSPQQVADAVIAIRQSKLPDPARLPNCGSFFKNPVIDQATFQTLSARYDRIPVFPVPDQPGQIKIPAAWLLDQAGWKGRRQGAAGVHREQAVVLVNHGGASGAELLALARDMQAAVLDRFGIALEPEVRIVQGSGG
ncbi:MAG: UDP-N-acetylmuramate dehydrogenase [Gammaproteobacteria bacterium]|nr:UDP-N-acetylmuramate dehydrogenase [Pseudomonadales bacterium]MCP5346106.1 UDP-N-acetylmuramate dehydrogenase [Pseudomonadales bacterium]